MILFLTFLYIDHTLYNLFYKINMVVYDIYHHDVKPQLKIHFKNNF